MKNSTSPILVHGLPVTHLRKTCNRGRTYSPRTLVHGNTDTRGRTYSKR